METKRYKLGEFWQECQTKGLMPPAEIMAQESQLFLQGADYIDIPISIIEDMERHKAVSDKREHEYQEISSHRLAGINAEGLDCNLAIMEYQECIAMGENSEFDLFHAYSYAYFRIIVLLHKNKEYEKELDYTEKLLSHELSDSEREKYSQRLNKLKSKIYGS